MQFRTEEDFVTFLLRLCGTDWPVMEASKRAFSQCVKYNLEIPLFEIVSMLLKMQLLLCLVSDIVLSPNCVSIAYVT